MEDKLKKMEKNGRQPQIKNGIRPKKNGRQPPTKKIEDNLQK